jgi:hypothetical protein
MNCKFEKDCFIFESDNMTCVINTLDSNGDSLRPVGSLKNFYDGLINRYKTEISFDSNNQKLTIKYRTCDCWNSYDCNCNHMVTFKNDLTKIKCEYRLCQDVINEFLKKYVFTMNI